MESTPEKKSKLAEILAALKGKAMEVTNGDSPEEMYHNFRGAAKEGIEEDVLPGVQKHLGDEAAAGTATALDMGLDYVAPEDPKMLAAGMLPIGRLGKLGKAGGAEARMLEREGAPVGTAAMNAGARSAEDIAAAKAARGASEAAAPTIVYGKGGPKRFTAEEMKKMRPSD